MSQAATRRAHAVTAAMSVGVSAAIVTVATSFVAEGSPTSAVDNPVPPQAQWTDSGALAPLPPSQLASPGVGGRTLLTISPEEQADLEAIADEQGISLDDAASKYSMSDDFNRWLETVRTDHPEEIAGVEWLPEGVGWVGFTGEALDEVVKSAEAKGIPLRVSTDLGYTEKATLQAVSTLSDDPYISSIMAEISPDHRDGSVLIKVRHGKVADLVKVTEAMKSRSVTTDVRVMRLTAQTPTVTVDYLRGGGRLSACTAGFVTRKTTGEKGLATAHHCRVAAGARSTSYNNWPIDSDGVAVTLWYADGSFGKAGDIGVYKAGSHASLPAFYATSNEKRYVNHAATGSPAVGSPVNKFGRTSGRTSGTVLRTGITTTLTDDSGNYVGTAQNQTSSTTLSQGGDSGGPYYYGRMALGIQSSTINGVVSYWSPLSGLRYFGFSVWTQ